MHLNFQKWAPKNSAQTQLKSILLLHGLGGTGLLWRPVAALLEDYALVIAPDQRGHGESRDENNTSFTALDFGQDIAELIEQENLKSVWLVGHSMGVRTALAACHLVPEQIEGCVCVDLNLTGEAGGGLGQTLKSFISELPQSFQNRSEARNLILERAPDPAIGQYLVAVLQKKTESSEVFFPFDQNALIQTIDQAPKSNCRVWLNGFLETQKPVYLLRGGKSRVWSAQEFEADQTSTARYSNAHFITYPDSGHGLPFEERSKFAIDLLSWTGAKPTKTE